ncbi:uncharacterized protein TRIVIDRAFT_227972 [Trichoderma virens Gv29-8]|uniref:MARVEL domain-containing protein n=1 Tax=Hypocrea virens (strain Gv29-8 / FGSC 10586) TaxID=413071 RepID=G9NB30_HYPVG|nr:uncharacterized protein TRIVIDRAFT_227972 [Trichoderma virens Gv29-8]EHK16040.1 hypothetical protein TRIVIDRAFT_227972 [Trichoderma virens Gv29-8]
MALGANLHNTAIRGVSLFCYIMVWISAIIVTGLVGNFLERFSSRGVDIVYMEVIAVITMVFYLVGMILPCLPKYGGVMAPLHLVFSYLWITAFIFAAQDWSHNRCHVSIPRSGLCGRKHAIEAFNFLAFFFTLCLIFLESWLFWEHRRRLRDEPPTHHITKERPASGVSGVSGDTTAMPPPVAQPVHNGTSAV